MLAAIVGDVKATAFKNQTCPGADQSFHAAFAPLLLGATFFGTGSQWLVGHALENLKFMPALGAGILICRHSLKLSMSKPMRLNAIARNARVYLI